MIFGDQHTAIAVPHAGPLARALAQRAAIEAPPEGLARPALCPQAPAALTRFARPRIAAFEAWLSAALRGEDTSAEAAVQGLIGLGPGLTPSGDDVLTGALALLQACRETRIHADLARTILAMAALTSPLSASFLRAAAAGHVAEHLYDAATSAVAGDAGATVAALRGVGHSSGWDMLAGIAVTLRAVAAARNA
jgi:uncharacterized protein DUF2877